MELKNHRVIEWFNVLVTKLDLIKINKRVVILLICISTALCSFAQIKPGNYTYSNSKGGVSKLEKMLSGGMLETEKNKIIVKVSDGIVSFQGHMMGYAPNDIKKFYESSTINGFYVSLIKEDSKVWRPVVFFYDGTNILTFEASGMGLLYLSKDYEDFRLKFSSYCHYAGRSSKKFKTDFNMLSLGKGLVELTEVQNEANFNSLKAISDKFPEWSAMEFGPKMNPDYGIMPKDDNFNPKIMSELIEHFSNEFKSEDNAGNERKNKIHYFSKITPTLLGINSNTQGWNTTFTEDIYRTPIHRKKGFTGYFEDEWGCQSFYIVITQKYNGVGFDDNFTISVGSKYDCNCNSAKALFN